MNEFSEYYEYRWLGDKEWKTIKSGKRGMTRLLRQDGLAPARAQATMRDGATIRLHDMELRIRPLAGVVNSAQRRNGRRLRLYHDGSVFIWPALE